MPSVRAGEVMVACVAHGVISHLLCPGDFSVLAKTKGRQGLGGSWSPLSQDWRGVDSCILYKGL